RTGIGKTGIGRQQTDQDLGVENDGSTGRTGDQNALNSGRVAGSRAQVVREFRRNGSTQSRSLSAANAHFLDRDFSQRKILWILAQQHSGRQLSGSQACRVCTQSKAHESSAEERVAILGDQGYAG